MLKESRDTRMVKVLLTGMSGVGKTTILDHLNQDGHLTIDLDYDGWIFFDGTMDVQRILDYINHNRNKSIFLAGTAINQKEIYPYLDFVITLTAPLEVMKERIQARENNSFGKSEEEWAKVVDDKIHFEARIIQSSDLTISTDKSIHDVMKEIHSSIGF